MKYLLVLIIVIHGTIHWLGFAQAYNVFPIDQSTNSIPMPQGNLWMVAAILFISCSILLFLAKDLWLRIAIVAISGLILSNWDDAKLGTLINIIILIAAIIGFGTWHFIDTPPRKLIQ